MMNDGNLFTDFLEKILEMSRWSYARKDQRYDYGYYTKTVKEKKKIFWIFSRSITKQISVPNNPESQEDMRADLLSDLVDFYGATLFPITSYTSTSRSGQSIESFVKKFVTYKMLWDFCDFIKLAEYIIFYPNSKDGNFYVEASDYRFKKYKEDDKKAINIKGTQNFDLRIGLEEVKDHLSNNTMHVIKLIIDRKENGKQVIICIDEISDDNIDCKDSMLLANLSDFICDACYGVFKDIINSIIEGSGVKLE